MYRPMLTLKGVAATPCRRGLVLETRQFDQVMQPKTTVDSHRVDTELVAQGGLPGVSIRGAIGTKSCSGSHAIMALGRV